MTDELEQRMHEAFDRAHMPAGLAERTLARIEAMRDEQPVAAGDGTEGHSATRTAALPQADAPLGQAPMAGRGARPDSGAGGRAAGRRPARRYRHRIPLVAALAACLVLAALGIGGVTWAWQPYAYVAIDVNPSIELGINRLDRVASTRAYNADGEQVLEAADVDGMPYEDAMDALEEQLQAYLADGGVVEITVTCDDDATATELETVGTRCLDAGGTGRVRCSHASEEEHHAAASAGIGVGKYRVWRELADAGVDIAVDEASSMTMRELLDLAEAEGVDTSTASTGLAEGEHRGAGAHHAENPDSGHDDGSARAASGSSQAGSVAGHGKRHRTGL